MTRRSALSRTFDDICADLLVDRGWPQMDEQDAASILVSEGISPSKLSDLPGVLELAKARMWVPLGQVADQIVNRIAKARG